ncbi:MAG: aminoacetone oxidase family FAD-binding enzyme, partial [Spirochaetales bacterium]|nr:aminoacetone oxidase family FAD-binding enzyme [Spirochaetales bacterium]
AGLFLAANLPDRKVLILDHAKSLGKKLLITGGGRANITNDLSPKEMLAHFPTKAMRNFLAPSLLSLTPSDLMNWFENRGVKLIVRTDGHVFPSSLDARTIRSALLSHIHADIRTGCTITAIINEEESFTIHSSEGSFVTRFLCLATGGMSYPATGSDGSGYTLAKTLGHTIVPPKPALTPIITKERTAHLGGISLSNVTVTHKRSATIGDLLFTHDGLSGPVILNLSRAVSEGDPVTIAVLDSHLLEENLLSFPRKRVSTIIRTLGAPASLAREICERSHLDPDRNAGTLLKEERKLLCRTAGALSFEVKTTKGFNQAMATSGGVELSEVDRKTMESRIAPDLFFCGEILDYDGETGGYNIQAACSTAYLAARTIGKRKK